MLTKETECLYTFKRSSYDENKVFFSNYLAKLKKPFDDYLEMNINSSVFYSISYRDDHIGFFSVLEEKYLTSFYLPDSLLFLAKDIFMLIVRDFNIEMILVTSFDEMSLCLCTDHLSNIKTHYLYYTQSCLPVRNPEYAYDLFRKARYKDIESIKKYSGSFIDLHKQRIDKEQLYILEDKTGLFLGLGLIIPHTLQSGICSLGVFIREDKRNNYAGRSILLHLSAVAKERKLSVRCACPVSNEAYGRALESAGFVNDSRLFVVYIDHN
ncbi:MAG: hypothetical protein WCY62_00130 [Clostridia bacterium]|jgi:hypothetical protein